MAQGPLSDEVWNQANHIDGWLFRGEAALLHELNVGIWCEVGSWKGRSTFVLAQEHKGYAIDWFNGIEDPNFPFKGVDTYGDFLRNTRAVRHNIALLAMRFQEAACLVRAPVDLLFLDAEHNYELTRAAWDLYSPLVAKGGHVVFHDAWDDHGEKDRTPFPTVTKVVNEIIAERGAWAHVRDVARCAVFERVL